MRAATTSRAVPLATLLRLGRVSNLPTVWTNVVAATAIAGGDPLGPGLALVLVAMTLFYVGGMYLNDAFDRGIDARERPGRPIPAGEIAASSVFGIGSWSMPALPRRPSVPCRRRCGSPPSRWRRTSPG